MSCDRNYHQEKKIFVFIGVFFEVFNMAHVPAKIIRGDQFVNFTMAHHQGVINMFWLHFREVLLFCTSAYSLHK